ncbi:MAG TPA: choice-of-anchor tandem repeat GloVer-containing protein [Pseudomonadales bacterium]|nr:choice-of-anchor tandem repeat GloVer-containing protein [Pseudomonadales bacterium]
MKKVIPNLFWYARWLCLLGCLLYAATNLSAAPVRKPAHTILKSYEDPRRIAVKFRDGLYIRLRNNALISTNTGLFASSKPLFNALASGKWQRADAISEDAMDVMRHRAEKNLGRALPDMNLQFYLTVPSGMDAAAVIDRLNQLDIVELAQPVPRPQRPPLPPNFEPMQGYMDAAPAGGSVFQVWTNYGVFGAGIRVADVEYSFNANHQDLPAINNLTPEAVDPFNDNDHGTATLGEIAASENGWGTTGIGHNVSVYFAGAYYNDGYDVGRGITTAASALRPGDVLLIEQQIAGPNTTPGVEATGGEYGLVPVDWFEPYYNDIVMAVANGIIVIETADNGGQNLDNPIYSTGNGGHWPFLPQNRSGAIFVGAGASFNGSSTESSRLYFSNYGSCVDVQNWGENIVTTGYGDLYSTEGPDLYYTSTFGGTSGATPIVVGEVALLQSIYQLATGQLLTASQIRSLLRSTASPQTGGTYPVFDNIGPLPNLALAIQTLLATNKPPAVVTYTTNATGLIGGTAGLSIAASGKQPLSYQWSFNGVKLTDDTNIIGSTNASLVFLNLATAQAGAYTVTITNSFGKVTVTNVLSVISPPWLTPGVNVQNAYSFTAAYDGSGAIGMTADGNGNFFGTQQYGGTNDWGGVFEFTPGTTNFTVLWSFTDGDDGAEPAAAPTVGSDGNIYGTSSGDNAENLGAVFSLDTFGDFNVLHTFTGVPDGANPSGTLLETSPGVFYGTTFAGGSGNQGTIFQVTSDGDCNIIHSFNNTDGSGPNDGLVLAGDGHYYGTTAWGGINGGNGTIYRLNADQTVTSLFSFNGANGINPSDNLVVGQDGKLYGRTEGGGDNGDGTIFSIATNGVFQSLFSFGGTNGIRPHAALFAGNDGNFYGATAAGGTNGQDGVIYEITPTGNFHIVAYFNGNNGLSAFGPLVRNTDGTLYGTTFNGGAYGSGNIYQLSFASTPAPDILNITTGAGQVILIASGTAGRAYQSLGNTNLNSTAWLPVGNPVTASNIIFTTTDNLSASKQKFYKLELETP